MEQKPSVGRIVHFNYAVTGPDGQPTIGKQAALIVEVHAEDTVSVVAWNGYGTSNCHRSITRGDQAGQWDWPARV